MTKAVGDAIDQLGQVQQAAVRLSRGVRAAIRQLAVDNLAGDQLTEQNAGSGVDDLALREAIGVLESRTRRLPPGERRTRLLDWIHNDAIPAADRRARVTNAEIVVAEDGTQRLQDHLGEEVDIADLRVVIDQLNRASRSLRLTID